MSNLDEVLAAARDNLAQEARQAEERQRESLARLADLDRMPDASPPRTSATDAEPRAVPAVSSSTALARGNSSMTPLEDVGIIEKTGVAMNKCCFLVRGNSAEDAALMEEAGIAMKMCGFGDQSGDPLGQQLCALAGFHPPSEESFRSFFRIWFEFQHFPAMSDALKYELVSRARSKGFFSGLSSQVKKWAMANADTRLQADTWHSYFIQNAPPTYNTYGCLRIAHVNLGAVARPCWVKFYGLPAAPDARDNNDQWVLMPWTGHDVDISALVDELDGRGGMVALLEAATSK